MCSWILRQAVAHYIIRGWETFFDTCDMNLEVIYLLASLLQALSNIARVTGITLPWRKNKHLLISICKRKKRTECNEEKIYCNLHIKIVKNVCKIHQKLFLRTHRINKKCNTKIAWHMRSKVKLWFIYQIDDGNVRSQMQQPKTR